MATVSRWRRQLIPGWHISVLAAVVSPWIQPKARFQEGLFRRDHWPSAAHP